MVYLNFCLVSLTVFMVIELHETNGCREKNALTVCNCCISNYDGPR